MTKYSSLSETRTKTAGGGGESNPRPQGFRRERLRAPIHRAQRRAPQAHLLPGRTLLPALRPRGRSARTRGSLLRPRLRRRALRDDRDARGTDVRKR